MIAELAAAIDAGTPVVLATVIRTNRSVPRRAGSKMLVFADGTTSGTVGGGEMEHRVINEAVDVLRTGTPCVLSYRLVDPNAGDPGVCGGEAEIYLEPYMPKPTLLIVGAGHVGRAVIELASWLDFTTVVWDDRVEMITELDHSDLEIHLAASGSLTALLEDHPLTADAAVVIVTRNVALDVEILPHILATPARYVGLMGSNRRWTTTRAKLAEAGVAAAELDRVQTPIGIEINAETPAEIAVSIMAAVVAARRGS